MAATAAFESGMIRSFEPLPMHRRYPMLVLRSFVCIVATSLALAPVA